VPFRDRFVRWIPRGWGWAWRLEEAVFGRRKPVDLSVYVLTLGNSPGAALAGLSLGPPDFSDTSGVQAWLLGPDQLKALQENIKQTPGGDLRFHPKISVVRRAVAPGTPGARVRFHPRISTADGVECRLFQGEPVPLNGFTNRVGLHLTCFPQVRSRATDLIACIAFSELVTNPAAPAGGPAPASALSIQTNLDLAVRLQIPKGSGFFLFDQSSRDPGRNHIGVLIELQQPGV
jgi:hypothetical protein